MFGESHRWMTKSLPVCFGGAKLAPPIMELSRTEYEHQVLWKAIYVAAHRPFQHARGNAIQARKIAIQHNFLTTYEINGLFDSLDRDEV